MKPGRVHSSLPGEHAEKYLVTTHPRNWHIAGEGPEYYQPRGWSEQGEPTAAKLIELGIL